VIAPLRYFAPPLFGSLKDHLAFYWRFNQGVSGILLSDLLVYGQGMSAHAFCAWSYGASRFFNLRALLFTYADDLSYFSKFNI
jgi:hypothetical protein